MGGKTKVETIRIKVNFQPRMPISMGIRPTAQMDQPVKKATIVPTPAPDLINPATIGKLTYGPPGDRPPAIDPIKIPLNPDSAPRRVQCQFVAVDLPKIRVGSD